MAQKHLFAAQKQEVLFIINMQLYHNNKTKSRASSYLTIIILVLFKVLKAKVMTFADTVQIFLTWFVLI
jgi:hypothetical protein